MTKHSRREVWRPIGFRENLLDSNEFVRDPSGVERYSKMEAFQDLDLLGRFDVMTQKGMKSEVWSPLVAIFWPQHETRARIQNNEELKLGSAMQ